MLVANAPQILVAHPSLPVNSVKELIALAKADPNGLQYASSGAGTMSHLSGVLLASSAGIKLTQIPYPGSAQEHDRRASRPGADDVRSSRDGVGECAGRQAQGVGRHAATRAAIAPDVPT